MHATLTQRLFPEQLSSQDVEKFVNLVDEKLIFAAREHSTPLLFKLSQMIVFFLVADTVGSGTAYFLTGDILFSLAIFLTSTLILSGVIIKEITDWFFHVYVITNRKIIEASYSPLSSEKSSSVLLNQLRCTEIDAEMHGFISEFFDIGDVTITFDRPTHQEEFKLRGIRSPRKIANHLSSILPTNEAASNQEVWFKNPKTEKFMFSEPVTYGGLHN